MSDDVTDFLEHYGIKGMRWGVRKDEKTSNASVKDSEKSAHRVRLEAKYISKGMSQSAAEKKASGRIKTEKVLLAIGAVAVTAAVAYVGSVEYQKRFSGVDLELGTKLTNINALGDKQNFNRRLYTTIDERDTQKYRGMLATALRRNADNTTIYEATLRSTERIKAPSQREAAKLYKEFRATKGNSWMFDKSYMTFNKNLADDQSGAGKEFYKFMSSKGYNAILDANDQFISGYSTRKPLIVFNAASSTVKVGQKVVDEQLSDRLALTQTLQIAAKAAAPRVGLGLAVVGGTKALDTKDRYGAVNSYFKEHPESKLSYAEVFSNLEVSADGYSYTK